MSRELTPRQKQVLKLILAGYTMREAGRLLGLSPTGVQSAKVQIMEKWEVENTIELIIQSIREGYLEVDPDEPVDPHRIR